MNSIKGDMDRTLGFIFIHFLLLLINWDISHLTPEAVAECSVRVLFVFLLVFKTTTHRIELSGPFKHGLVGKTINSGKGRW